MPSSPPKGRWVILFDDHTPTAFWSSQREVLDNLCRQLHHTCPTARVAWQAAPESAVANHIAADEEGEDK